MHKYEVGDTVLVYQCVECVSGSVGVVTSRDAMETAYCVQPLDPNLGDFWAKEEFIDKLDFVKKEPESIIKKLLNLFR